jgi:hypothetical protein
MNTQVYEEIVKILGLQGEFRGQCFPPGDASVFAPVDIAFFAFFAKLSLSKAFIIDSFTSLLYDVILFSTVTERVEGIPIFDEVTYERFECFFYAQRSESSSLLRRALPRTISCIHRFNRNFWRKASPSRRRFSVIGNLPRTSPSSGTIPWSREMDPSSHRYARLYCWRLSLSP